MGKIKDITGQRFGKWTVVDFAGLSKRNQSLWNCVCACGTQRAVKRDSLVNGYSKSCGCSRPVPYGRLPVGEASFRALYRYMEWNSRYRKIEWGLDLEFFSWITKQPCHYCGVAPEQVYHPARHNGEYIYNGIDRVDNESGYIPENCVPCCGHCNYMKSAWSVEDFKEWIKSVYHHWAKL